jgi:hypothetical protein
METIPQAGGLQWQWQQTTRALIQKDFKQPVTTDL